ncbi:MAG: hypothetical protein WCO60_20190 [Verrucomicrobiota bacterium]
MKLADLPEFQRGYFAALFFCNDEDAPSGDYLQTGRADTAFDALDENCKAIEILALEAWQHQHRKLLIAAEDNLHSRFSLGSDLYYTAAGHGCGYWDGDYEDTLGECLTEAANTYRAPECVEQGDDGKLYLL